MQDAVWPMLQVDECDHSLTREFQSQMKARCWGSKSACEGQDNSLTGQTVLQTLILLLHAGPENSQLAFWLATAGHYCTAAIAGGGGSWNTYFYRFTEVITLVGHYQLPGKVSKPGSWIKIINKNKTEHLSKDRELTESSSSYGPRDHGWNC